MTLTTKLSYLFSSVSIIGLFLINGSLGQLNDYYSSAISSGAQNLSLRSRSELGRSNYLNPIYGVQFNGGVGHPTIIGNRFQETYTNSPERTSYATKTKRNRKKDEQLEEIEENDTIESKTQEEEIPDQLAVETETSLSDIEKEQKDGSSSRACTACVNGDCSPNTVISGLPAVQIMVAMIAGAVCAAIFIFLYKNFIEQEPESSGYGYPAAMPQSQYGAPQSQPTMQYGAPTMQYGAPTKYGTPSRNGYARSFGSFDFNQLSNFVWKALEKFADSSVNSPIRN